MDSGLGHGNVTYSGSSCSKEESVYRDQQKDLLAIQNGYRIIRIDCAYYGNDDKFKICKQAIQKSLRHIYTFDRIDWKKINSKASKSSIVKEVCDMYNDGFSSGEISAIIERDWGTVIKDLRKGKELGWCNYEKRKQVLKRNSRNIKPIICEDTNDAFSSYVICERVSLNVFGKIIRSNPLSNALSKYKGLSFKKITREDFLEHKILYPNKTYGEV